MRAGHAATADKFTTAAEIKFGGALTNFRRRLRQGLFGVGAGVNNRSA